MDPYISRAGGYLENPDSVAACRFCSFRTTDEFLDLSFNIKYSRRWRDAEIFAAFILFNVRGNLRFLDVLSADSDIVGCFDLSVHVRIPDEAMGPVEIVQMAKEVDP